MLIYKFCYPNNINSTITVEIDLLDNPFVNAWKEYIIQLYTRLPKIVWYITRHGYNDRFLRSEQLVEFLSRLHASFLFFQKKKIGDYSQEIKRIEFLFQNPSQTNQTDLNIWHRHFTTLEGKYSLHADRTPPNTLTMDLYEYIHDVNQFVHRCEGWTYADCPRRIQFTNSPMYAVQFTNANNMSAFAENDNKKVWDQSTPRLSAGFYDPYTEGSDHTVWLHEDIIGKDQVKAWLDNDDLTQFDVTGNDCMTPNVTFDPTRVYHRVLQEPNFKKESLASSKTFDRPPLGNIRNISEIDFDSILDKQVYSIELDGKLLWNKLNAI